MLTEDYCDFETAKLLKEKGFDIACEYQYINCSNGLPFLTDIPDDSGNYYKNSEIGNDEYSAPTLQMAMRWLREVYHMFIWVSMKPATQLPYYYQIFDTTLKEKYILHIDGNLYGTYEMAIEAAIKYCLENLI